MTSTAPAAASAAPLAFAVSGLATPPGAALTVLVTGANGFLGRAVVAELLAQGHAVRAGVRDAAAGAWPASVQPVLCDVASGAGLAAACDGIDAVIHLAAAMGGSAAEQESVAVEGSARLIEAMAAHPAPPRLLLASSFAVYDWDRVGATLDESSPLLDPDKLDGQDAYTRAKLLQEALVRRLCARHGIGLVVLRPALIWSETRRDLSCLGPGAAGARLVVAPGRALRLTHVRNCASAFVAALDPRALGHTFNIDDASGVQAWSFAADSGVRWRLPVPLALLAAVAALGGAVLRPLVGAARLPGLLVPARLRTRFHGARAGHAALAAQLGWQPPVAAHRS